MKNPSSSFLKFNRLQVRIMRAPHAWRFCAAILSALLTVSIWLGYAAPAIGLPPAAQCPQPRFTGAAPDDYLFRKNPLPPTAGDLATGEQIYLGKANNFGCAACHGPRGQGDGVLASQFDPPPRNFSCAKTVNGIPDGQLFWIIRFGSPGAAMPAHKDFADAQIWQLVSHLRRLAK